MKYTSDKLPDFFSVRNTEQIDYSFEGMKTKKCFCFFDNGFSSNIIEPNKRDIKFIWDGFILFTEPDITIEDIRNGINLHDARLVALQRTKAIDGKSKKEDVRKYIEEKLKSQGITFEILDDKKEVAGYPSASDLWSTRDFSVLLDAIDTVGEGDAYYFKDSDFRFNIEFNESHIPTFSYSHNGAIVLRGTDNIAISRLMFSDENLKKYLEETFGEERIYSYIEGRNLPGAPISIINDSVKKY